jgi:hypothetical protein
MSERRIIEPMWQSYLSTLSSKGSLSPREEEAIRDLFYTGVVACHTAFVEAGKAFRHEQALRIITQEVDEFLEAQ